MILLIIYLVNIVSLLYALTSFIIHIYWYYSTLSDILNLYHIYLINLSFHCIFVLVLGKFSLCLKLISEMKVKMISDFLEILHKISLDIGDSVCKFSKQSNIIFTFISLISFRHKPNFPNTTTESYKHSIHRGSLNHYHHHDQFSHGPLWQGAHLRCTDIPYLRNKKPH